MYTLQLFAGCLKKILFSALADFFMINPPYQGELVPCPNFPLFFVFCQMSIVSDWRCWIERVAVQAKSGRLPILRKMIPTATAD
jgi:hypothetical protein